MIEISLEKLVLQKLLAPFALNDKINTYLSEDDRVRIRDYQNYWNFYNGYHWEQVIDDDDKTETTTNWCARFVDKYVASEFNSGFLFKFDSKVEEKVLPFLNEVWDDNDGSDLMSKVGQAKSITGDAFVHIYFEPPDKDKDPFGMYPKGRIRLFNIPPNLVFPKYKDGYNDNFDALESVTIMYQEEQQGFAGRTKQKIVRYVYTNDTITQYENDEKVLEIPNKYGIIPIVPFRNLPLVGSMFGQSDLKNLTLLNAEYNLKNSDISQTLDYNSAPTTIVQGAKPHNLEKGANRVWCVPKEAKVYNLELKGDLVASTTYIDRVRDNIYNIGSMPKLAIGGETAPSNLSGLALQIAFMPLTDLISQKRIQSSKSISYINKIILKIGLVEKLIKMTSGVKPFKFFSNTIWWGEVLPKDRAIELEQIQQELKAGLTDRQDAMTRLYKDNVTELVHRIDEDIKQHPQFYSIQPLSMPAGNRLVNTFDGRVIVKPLTIDKDSTSSPQIDLKGTVGRTREGEDKKLNSGLGNTNPPKE